MLAGVNHAPLVLRVPARDAAQSTRSRCSQATAVQHVEPARRRAARKFLAALLAQEVLGATRVAGFPAVVPDSQVMCNSVRLRMPGEKPCRALTCPTIGTRSLTAPLIAAPRPAL